VALEPAGHLALFGIHEHQLPTGFAVTTGGEQPPIGRPDDASRRSTHILVEVLALKIRHLEYGKADVRPDHQPLTVWRERQEVLAWPADDQRADRAATQLEPPPFELGEFGVHVDRQDLARQRSPQPRVPDSIDARHAALGDGTQSMQGVGRAGPDDLGEHQGQALARILADADGVLTGCRTMAEPIHDGLATQVALVHGFESFGVLGVAVSELVPDHLLAGQAGRQVGGEDRFDGSWLAGLLAFGRVREGGRAWRSGDARVYQYNQAACGAVRVAIQSSTPLSL
jgi:hypothetical protein